MRQPRRLCSLFAAVCSASLLFGLPASATESAADAVFDERATLTGAYLAARIAGNAGDTRAAAEFYVRALADDPENPELLERVFLNLLATGQMEAAFEHAHALIRVQPTNRTARLALAIREMRGRNYPAARQHLKEAQAGRLADLTAGLIDGWALEGLGRTDEAIEVISDLTGPDWYTPFKTYHIGLINAAAGRIDAARKNLKLAYEAESGALRNVEAMARFEARNDGKDEALKILEAFDRVLPGHPNVDALRRRIKSGDRIAPIASSPLDGAGETVLGLGMALAREGGEDIAIIYLQLAAYALDNDAMALAALADVFERQEAYAEAIAAYDKVPEDDPITRSAETKRALNLDALDRTQEAETILKGLIDADLTDFEAIIALGNIYRARQRFEEAATTYARAIDPIDEPTRRDWTLYYYRGIAFERSKNWLAAEADLLQALALYPDQPLVLNYLGYSWVDQGINLDDGLNMIKQAVAQRPRDGYIVDSLGWVYYRLGRYEEAVEHLERAVELRPQDPVINDHLGDAYWRAGRRLEAQFQWGHARDLDPEPEDLEKIEAKLKDGMVDEDVERAARDKADNGG